MTVIGNFLASAQRHPKRDCLLEKRQGRYQAYNYAYVAEKVGAIASALYHRGVRQGDRVALMATNCPEWPMMDLGIQMAGAVTVPVYPTLTPQQVTYILNDCEAKLLFVENAELLAPLLPHRHEMHALEGIVQLFGDTSEATTFGAFIQEGGPEDQAALKGVQVSETDLASIVYTSGTTGNPKGVMLSHGNLASNAEALVSEMKLTCEDRALSFLPLSHALERIVHISLLTAGGSLAYVVNQASLAQNFAETNPTLMVCVPRLFEKLRSRMMENILASSWVTKNLFFWGFRNALRVKRGEKNPWVSLKASTADALVFSKIRRKFGTRLRFFVSGGASLTTEVAEYFSTLGFEILEGYGLTETSPVITVNRSGKGRIGTVGQVLPNLKIRLSEDGEIQVSGPSVMQGYFNNADATREVLQDGWLATGDIGALDQEGYLSIVDRKKEILVMSNGKNVAPQPLENALKKSKFISMAMLVGDQRNYVTALVVPNLDPLARQAKQEGWEFKDKEELLALPMIRELFSAEISRHTREFARFEQIKDFAFAEEFTQERDEMTPTLKYKRQVILRHYEKAIERMYVNVGPSESPQYSLHTASTAP